MKLVYFDRERDIALAVCLDLPIHTFRSSHTHKILLEHPLLDLTRHACTVYRHECSCVKVLTSKSWREFSYKPKSTTANAFKWTVYMSENDSVFTWVEGVLLLFYFISFPCIILTWLYIIWYHEWNILLIYIRFCMYGYMNAIDTRNWWLLLWSMPMWYSHASYSHSRNGLTSTLLDMLLPHDTYCNLGHSLPRTPLAMTYLPHST